ncbi:MAG: response regulator [Deltaproteobacteria bacterium]|nr:response regulator [Deltaproteobacteria bacterium]
MKTANSPFRKSLLAWLLSNHIVLVWSAIVLSVLVCMSISWIHIRQQQVLGQTVSALENIRQARIELTKGFLYTSLAANPSLPFNRDQGLALLEQAISSLEGSLRSLDKASPRSPVMDPTGTGAAFRGSVLIFRDRLTEWSKAATRRPELETNLRIAFHDLERQADRIDAQIQRNLRELSSRLNLLFALTLWGAALLLAGICSVVFLTGRAQQKSETALQENEKRLRTILETLPVGVLIFAKNGRILTTNAMVKQIWGSTNETAPFIPEIQKFTENTGWWPDTGTPLKPEDWPAAHALLKDETVLGEIINIQRFDGSSGTIISSAVPLRDTAGCVTSAVAVIQDITELRQAEEALRKSASDLKKAQQAAHLGNWAWDIKTNKIEWSDELYHIFGLDKNMAAGDLDKVILQATHPDDRSIVEVSIHSVMRDINLQPAEYRVIWPDKSTHSVWVEAGELTRDDAGEPDTLTGIAIDITERKRMEEERRELEKQLQRAEKMEAIGVLAGGVAHDLNNVLGISVGYSELVLDYLEESNPLRTHIREILKASERAAAIVQDMLTLARRGVQTRKVINLNAIIMDYEETPEFVRLSSSHPNIRINTNLEADLLNIMGSAVHLRKAIMNLVSNAAEAMVNGGLLAITTSNQYLDRPIHGYDEVREGDYAVLTVSDSGEGISAHDIKHIFEPFYTKKVMGKSGTGLGLAVVWGLVKDHNGYIDVQSEVGKGTSFKLYFPVTRGAVSEDRLSIPLSEYRGRDESILVVDDVKEQLELAVRILGKLNYRVTTASSGAEAVEYLKHHTADLIIMDMIMEPGMDGLETYKKILEINPKQKTIIVSGFSETDRVSQVRELGVRAYIRKPYSMERLGLVIRRELDKTEEKGESENRQRS